MMKINTYNDKWQKHGYWKVYHLGKVWFDGNYINGKKIGYIRSYHYNTSYILVKKHFII